MKITLKGQTGKWIQTVILAAINFLLWAIPSNVAYLIAQNRDVLLGRYSVAHLTWIFLLIPISIMALYLIWSNEENKRKRQFQITALALSIIVPILLFDLLLRLSQPKQYVMQKSYYHLAPDKVTHGTNHDVPENAFSYPEMRPGYPDIEYTLTTDKRGFRNKTNLEKYDMVALGDSFTEGSNVTDDEVWPAILAQQSNLTVYNLGMAGSHPGIYLETLKKFGIILSPKIVLCMFYEGNDFRDSNYKREDTIGYYVSHYFKSSPLRLALEGLLIRRLGSTKNKTSKVPVTSGNSQVEPNQAAAHTPAVSALAWMPVPVPDGPEVKYYTFTVKNLLAHFETRDTFLRSKGCQQTFTILRQIKKICHDNHIRLIIVYGPDKPHVLMPLICNNISPETLREFMALKAKKLPPADRLKNTVLSRLDIEEFAVKEFCRQESIEFISLTESLRRGTALGRQLYFTYDDHWTPLGHETVANTINNYINELHAIKTEQQAEIENPE
jgi:hypothetical protein